MAGLALSGLASGVDTATIVEQLMAIERQSLTRLQTKQAKITARDTGLKDVQSKLSALKSAATALKAADLWANKQTVGSSDPARIGVERISGAGTGGSTVQVLALAGSAQRTYGFVPDAQARTFTFSPTDGSPAVTVGVGAGATLDDVVTAINAKADSPVFAAAVVPRGGGAPELVLSARKTGLASDFTLSQTVGAGALTPTASSTSKPGRDASYLVDGANDPLTGLPYVSPTNVVENGIPGLRLTFKSVTADAVGITVGAPGIDTDAVKAKVKAFVDAYNATVTTTRAKTTERTVPAATSTLDKNKGQLFGDTGLSSTLGALRNGANEVLGDLGDTFTLLREIGVDMGVIGSGGPGSDAVAGKLVINDAKLTAALTTDPVAVRKLLGGTGTTGLAQRFETIVDQQVGDTGILDQRLKNSVGEQKRLTDELARADTRLAGKEKRLKAQFAAMELALQASQTQQAWLSGQLAAFNKSS